MQSGIPKASIILASYLPEKEELNLTGKKLNAQDVKDHVIPFLTHHTVKTLKLGGNDLGDEGVEFLCSGLLLAKYEISSLYLGCNSFGAKGAECIAELIANTPITTLDLSENLIGLEGMQAIAEGLIANPVMESINLFKCVRDEIGRVTEGGEIMAFASALPHLENLATLILEFNPINDQETRTIATALPCLKKLALLNLGVCNLGINEFKYIIANVNPGIRQLNLRGNKIGDAGARAIADSSNLRYVESLNLANCEIGDEGIQAIVSAQKCLAFLDLSYNPKIGIEGAKALATILPDLQSLNLSDCSADWSIPEATRIANILASVPCGGLMFIEKHRIEVRNPLNETDPLQRVNNGIRAGFPGSPPSLTRLALNFIKNDLAEPGKYTGEEKEMIMDSIKQGAPNLNISKRKI